MVDGFKFVIKEAEVVVAHLLGDLVDGQGGIGQQKTGLVHPLQDQQLLEGAAGLLFDVGAQVVRVEAKMPRCGFKGGGQVVLFDVLQNFYDQAGVAAAGGKCLVPVLAQYLAAEQHHTGVHRLPAAQLRVIILTKDALDDGMDAVLPAPAEQQILVVGGVRRQGADQEAVDDGVVPEALQKALGQVLFAHLDGDDDVLCAEPANAVGDVCVQQADVAGAHLDLSAVDVLGAAAGVDVKELNDGMDVLRDGGKAGLLVDADVAPLHQGIEAEQVHLPPGKVHPRDPLVAVGQRPGRVVPVAQLRFRILFKEGIQLPRVHGAPLLSRSCDLL